jgi:hypothetical protein
LHQLNSVAGLTTEHVIFLKRKFVSKSGWELEKRPLNDFLGITYSARIPLGRIVGGLFLVALIAAIIYFLVVYWGSLEPGQRIPVGAIVVAGIYGVNLLLGARQHKFVFLGKTGFKLTWKSRSGEFDVMKPSVEGIIEFATQKGLLMTPTERR